MRRTGWLLACTAFAVLAACTETNSDDGDSSGAEGPVEGSSGQAADSSGSGGMAEPIELVRADAWEVAAAADDPFPDERPEFVQCEIGWDVVTGVFELDTSLCTYAAFVQPTLHPIAAGDRIEVHIQHGELPADGPGSAHLAIAFGSEIAWETEVPIPAEPGDVTATWEASATISVGTPVHLHLHDHDTTYRFISLTRTSG